jgi:malonyl-CoA O-methyltransferase
MGPFKAIDSALMRGHFSRHADEYDSYASVQKRVVALMRARMSEVLALSPAAEGMILDVGTGTGALAAVLHEAAPRLDVVVMDIAHGMTCAAAARLPALCACDGDAVKLPFTDASFTGVISSSVYQWVECLPSAFAEVNRVLRPGGLFALALFGEETLFELRRSHRQAVADSERERVSHVQEFPSCAEVAAALDSAGLACLDLSSSMEVEYHGDVAELLRRLKRIGAGNAAANRPRGMASRRLMQSMIARYDANYRSSLGVPASYQVIVAIAERPVG